MEKASHTDVVNVFCAPTPGAIDRITMICGLFYRVQGDPNLFCVERRLYGHIAACQGDCSVGERSNPLASDLAVSASIGRRHMTIKD